MSKLLKEIKALDSYEVFRFFDPEYEGSCPCFSGKKTEDGKTLNVEGRCWRVSENMTHSYQDLHVWGDHPQLKELGEAVKKALDDTKWYNEYKIIEAEQSIK